MDSVVEQSRCVCAAPAHLKCLPVVPELTVGWETNSGRSTVLKRRATNKDSGSTWRFTNTYQTCLEMLQGRKVKTECRKLA